MEKLIFTFLLFAMAFSAQAQHDYISSSGNVILYSGSIERYSSPDIYINFRQDYFRQVYTTTLQLGATGTTTNFIKAFEIEFDNATIDGYTQSGSTSTDGIRSAVLQAVEDYLIVLNGAIFTLH